MPHLHTSPGEHDHTVSAFIVRLDDDEPRLLLHRHRKLGKLLQFGGHIELSERPWQAISHEILEESGYKIDQLCILQPAARFKAFSGNRSVVHPVPAVYSTHPFNDEHFHTDIAWVFATDQKPARKPLEGEAQDIRSFSRDELLHIPDSATYPDIKDIGEYIFSVILPQWEMVPTDTFR